MIGWASWVLLKNRLQRLAVIKAERPSRCRRQWPSGLVVTTGDLQLLSMQTRMPAPSSKVFGRFPGWYVDSASPATEKEKSIW